MAHVQKRKMLRLAIDGVWDLGEFLESHGQPYLFLVLLGKKASYTYSTSLSWLLVNTYTN